MEDIAVATKVFKRTNHLIRLLESVERTNIPTVYVADDGEEGENDAAYERDWEFELEVINLEFDAGLGYGRKRFVEESSETYLLVVDTDHEIPDDWLILRDILDCYPSVGGVSGITIENGTVGGMCHDIRVKNGVLVRHAPRKSYDYASGHPFLEFDFIPNVTLFRRECLEDYVWDPNYVIAKEHLDFYYGHYLQTDWTFGVSPSVAFPHHETTDETFLKFRESEIRQIRSKRYFLEKWGLDQIHRESYWLDATPHEYPIVVRVGDYLPLPIQKVFYDLNDRYRVSKGKLGSVTNDD
jgi:hypothetical protein